MALTRADVEQVARLAALSLSEQELEAQRERLASLAAHFDALLEVDVEGVPPFDPAAVARTPLRADVVGASLPLDEALASAPAKEGPFFSVPRILE
jgi:aspartyl-tRNA(Asn)/glutamyl-tRNA(Gln) amidotransferase subunit C